MANKPDVKTIQNFNMGGLSGSKWSGVEHSLWKMVGVDPHSKPGILGVEQKLEKNSGATVSEFVKCAVASSNGNSYWFSADSGKIWERVVGGTWRLVHTTTPTSGEAKCLGAKEYDGYIYWATEEYLHRIDVDDADDNNWAVDADEDWAEFKISDDEFHPMKIQNRVLFIGDGNYVAQVDTVSYSAFPKADPGLQIRANFDVENANAIHYEIDNTDYTLAANTLCNTGTSATIPADRWGIFRVSVDTGGNLTATWDTNFGNGYDDETEALNNIPDTPASECSIGYVTVKASAGNDWVAGTDALQGGAGGNPSPDTNYYYDEPTFFSGAALDIPRQYKIKALGKYYTNLLIGTYVSGVGNAKLFTWNTWSVSYNRDDSVDEIGINAFIESDNYVYVSAGDRGNLYIYSSKGLELHRRFPGDYDGKTAMIHPNSSCTYNGQWLIGLSNLSGNPTDCGVYRIARHAREYPYILDMPYPISQRDGDDFVLRNVEIGAMIVSGGKLYVAWDNNGTYGVDEIDYSIKLDGAYIESRIYGGNRRKLANLREVVAAYAEMPTDCSFSFYISKNYGSYQNISDTIKDIDKNIVTADWGDNMTTLQFKLVFNTDSNNCPWLESIGLYFI